MSPQHLLYLTLFIFATIAILIEDQDSGDDDDQDGGILQPVYAQEGVY